MENTYRVPLLDSQTVERNESAYETKTPSEEVFQEGSWLFNKFFKFLLNYSKFVVCFWFIVFCIGISTGFQFLAMSDDSHMPPAGTRAYKDLMAYDALFPDRSRSIPLIVLIKSKNQSLDLGEDQKIESFAADLKHEVEDYNKEHPGFYISSMSYYSYKGTPLDSLKDTFISPDHAVTFINILVNNSYPTAKRALFMDWFLEKVKFLNPDKSKYYIGVSGNQHIPIPFYKPETTGLDAIGYSMIKHSISQLERTDGITIPIAMCLLGYMVGSWKFLALTIYNMIGAVTTAMAIMVFFVNAGIGQPDSICAQLMQGMSLGLSIDYSLFIFTRINEELKSGETTEVAVYRSLMHAGHVIIMSGLTIVVVFLGFVVLPSDKIKVDGLGCSMGVLLSIIVAITSTPSIVLLCPQFFSSTGSFWGQCCSKCFDKRRNIEDIESEGENSDSLARTKPEALIKPMYKTFRFRFTSWITKWPQNIISMCLLYLCVVPLAWQITRIDINEDILAAVPRNSQAGSDLRLMMREFSPGSFSPFSIVISTAEKGGVHSPKLFEVAAVVSSRIFEETSCNVDQHSVTSPAFIAGKKVPYYVAESLLGVASSWPCKGDIIPKWAKSVCTAAREYEFMFESSVNSPDENAMIITAMVPFFPFSKRSQPFIDKVYNIIDNTLEEINMQMSNAKHLDLSQSASENRVDEISIHFCGAEVENDVTMRVVYSLFPFMIGFTLITVFFLMGYMMRSAFVPVRLALTLFIPLLGVYGVGILVYQDGMLNWLSPATRSVGGFYWFIPILFTSIVCGLALDYDVFLITRIIEHRSNGYDIRASIVKAVCEIGNVIASAGIIMTLAFGGMLFSDQSTLDMGGFLLSTAVLFDTFVVNTILVPALMSVGDRIAWWPTKMEFENLKTLDDPEFTGEYTSLSDSSTDHSTTYDSLPSYEQNAS